MVQTTQDSIYVREEGEVGVNKNNFAFEKKKSTKDVLAPENNSTGTLESLFGVASKSSPTQKVRFACKMSNCPKPAKYAHKGELHDNPVMCEKHAAGIGCTYKPISAPL